jgi:hypothetical protein
LPDTLSSPCLTIEELGPSQDDELSEFLDRLCDGSPSVLGYHYPCYRDVLVSLQIGQPAFLSARRNGVLVGVLPLFLRRSEVGLAYSSLPFFGPNAGVLCVDGFLGEEIHFALLHAFLDKVREEKAVSCSLYTPFLFRDFSWYDQFRPDIVVDRTTLYTDLANAEWNSSIQYDLRRARRLGVGVTSEVTPERLDAFYAIYCRNCSDRSIPIKARECVSLLVRPEILGRHTRIYFAMKEGEVIAGLLVVFSPATASYYIPCTRDDARTLQPGTLLVDNAVRDLRAAGVRFWNWEASPDPESGVYRYKKKWNSIEASYRIYIWCPGGVEPLRRIGKDRLRDSFPAFFVYPYDQL